MIPFKDTYYENKIKDFTEKCNIKDDYFIGDFKVEYEFFKSGRINAYMHNYKGNLYNYPRLKEKEEIWMEVNAVEVGGCYEASRRAHGRVGIVGLGLGYYLQEIIDKEKVESIVVYEKSKEVIELYIKNFGLNPKVEIVNMDAFEVEGENFDFFFVDIYKNNISLDIADHYIKLISKNNIKDYVFWGVEHFILSCDSEDVKSANLPKLWIDMADNLGDRFYQSKYKENFIPVPYDKSYKLLRKFEEIF